MALLLLGFNIRPFAQPAKSNTSNAASANLQKQLQLAKQDTAKLSVLKQLVDLNIDMQPQMAETWIKQGMELASQMKNAPALLGFSLQELRLLNQLGKFQLTLDKAAALTPLAEKQGTPQLQTARLMSMGHATQKLGMYDSAARLYTKVITICRTHQLKQIELTASMNLAILFQYQNRIEEMRQHLLQTLDLAKQHGLADNIPMIQMNLSNAEARLNNFGKAIEYLQEVVPVYTAKNNQFALGLAYANLSWCYYKSEKLNQALESARKSYQIRSTLNDAAGLAHLDLNLGKIYLGLGKFDSAGTYALAALQKSRALHLVTDIRDNYETLAKLNEQQKNYPAALAYFKLYADWKDSVSQNERQKLVEQEFHKIKYDSLLHLKQLLVHAEKQQQKSHWWAGLLAAAATCLFIILVWQHFRHRGKLQKTALAQAQQRGDAMAGQQQQAYAQQLQQLKLEQIAQQKQFDELLQVKNQLQQQLDQQASAGISELRALIETDKLHSDSYWNEFLLLFSRVYPEFFKNIKAAYPDLTQHELRICAMIKLNHGVLDTAKVLNITVDSVRKARYRLYKKMGLANDQELVDLIIQS